MISAKDKAELRRLALAASSPSDTPLVKEVHLTSPEASDYIDAASPRTILALLDEIEELRGERPIGDGGVLLTKPPPSPKAH